MILRRWLAGPFPLVVVAGLLLASLAMMSDATQNAAPVGHQFSALLALNVLAAAILIVMIGVQVSRLVRQVRRRIIGSRLTARMVLLFGSLAVAPVSVVYVFSVQFIDRSIDSWFDVRIGAALEDALEIGRAALEIRTRELVRQGESHARDLALHGPNEVAGALNRLLAQSSASEVSLLDGHGRVLGSSSVGLAQLTPSRPPEAVWLQTRSGAAYSDVEPVGDGLQIRVAVPLPAHAPGTPARVLHLLHPVAERLARPVSSVGEAYTRYRELAYLRDPLKLSFKLTLSLVLLLSVLTALWAALHSARRLTAPIRDLAAGTRAVAAGDFDSRLPTAGADELGILVASFNEMTARLARARDLATRSQGEVAAQKTYLEAILGQLSAGVIALDPEGRIRAANEAAARILGATPPAGQTLADWASAEPRLGDLLQALDQIRRERHDWQAELAHGEGGVQTLLCRGALLPAAVPGALIVFDDITALIRAQRLAAWGDVARRLAHEIKNPLTPIQLAAERLRSKCLPALAGPEYEVLDRYTRTIAAQVETLKELVNAFSEYARAPTLRLAPTLLGPLAVEVADLYRGDDTRLELDVDLPAGLPPLHADATRLRQLLLNLVKNAVEAVAGLPQPRVRIGVAAVEGPALELTVTDNGPGLPPDLAERVFDPYVTGKTKGTGLGLAIVRRIVEEHGGIITLESPPGGGLCARVRFPLPVAAPTAPATA